MTEAQKRAFKRLVGEVDADGHRLWLGTVDRKGYGLFNWTREDGRFLIGFAHRAAWLIYRGGISDRSSSDPNELKVLHKCDVPPCTRIGHLFLGTQFDNLRDRDQKGRVAHGDDHYRRRRCQITPELVEKIRAARVSGKLLREIAEEFDLSRSYIHRIVRREVWA